MKSPATGISNTEEVVYTKVRDIAEEVLGTIKELYRENRKQIDSDALTEKLLSCDTVRRIVSDSGSESISYEVLSALITEKLGHIIPAPSPDGSSAAGIVMPYGPKQDFRKWLDHPFRIIKDHLKGLHERNRELEEFTRQTMNYLSETENHILSEMSFQQQKINDERHFEENITQNMAAIEDNITESKDFHAVKMAVMSKIENIKKGIDIKREKDRARFMESEKNLQDMTRRMSEIKKEADEIRKKSEEMEFQSVHDNLTGLNNRRAYDQKITETLDQVRQHGITASLMVCDIDFFKKINDTYGHKVGDLALKKLASLLRERLRGNDFISRYGGEEFAIIMPHTDMHGALLAAEGIRSYIASAVFAYKDKKIPLTISVGVSLFRQEDNGSTVFERADAALYLAKKSGRNTVRCETDAPADVQA